MRHAEWKQLLKDPVVLKARQALHRAQQALHGDAFWKDKVNHLNIFPDPDRRRVLQLLVIDAAFASLGQPPLTKREIAWEQMAQANPEEAQALVLAVILQFRPEGNTENSGG